MEKNVNKSDFLELEKIVDKNFSELAGYVFTYDENGYNETIFKNFLGLNLENFENENDFLKNAKKNLEIKIKNFENLIKKIYSGEIILGKTKKYVLSTLNENLEFIKNLKNIIKIESQKIKKFNYKIEEKKLKNILKKTEDFEKTIYGEKLSENKVFSLEIIESLENIYKENKDKITKEEQIFLENILKISRKNTGIGNKKSKKKEKTLKLDDNFENQEILEKEIKREDYIKVFKNSLEILGLKEMDAILDEKSGNFKVSIKGVHIPKTKNYRKLSIKRIIDLISHEIETHLITQKNNSTLVGFLKPIGYTQKEEGIAMTFGKLAIGESLENITKPGRLEYIILIGELFSGQDLEKFLNIFNKLTNNNLDVKNLLQRAKRGRDFDLPGVNPKDKSYFYGRKKIVEKISSGENFLNLFIGKNNFKQEKELIKILGKDSSIENFRKKGIVLPLMIGEILRYKLLTKSEENKGLLGGFFKYFCKKYGKLFNNLGIDYKDFVKNYIGLEKEENKKRITEILEIFVK